MELLAAGLILFIGIHLVPTAPSLREPLVRRMGANGYKGAFSLVSAAGLALIVIGYRMAAPGAQLFAPAALAKSIAPLVVTVSFVLLAAANMPSHLRRVLQHPMLLGVLLWSGVHLLANGDARGTLLFGAIFAWAAVDLVSAVRRRAVKKFQPSLKFDAIALIAGIGGAVAVMYFHGMLFGKPLLAGG